ncbi:MAG: chloride channel protein [Oscillospiraceae bacterium]|nr:chloride channel protein [Oscillospiraceae bacterium]
MSHREAKEKLGRGGKCAASYISRFLKWVVIAGVTGGSSGVVGAVFFLSVNFATRFRALHPFIIWLLPIGGLLTVAVYRLGNLNFNAGTNMVLRSIRSEEHVPLVMVPLIFASTVITHFVGGSAGREGAALQIGGGIGSEIGRLFRLDAKDMHIVTLCGMSGVFSALFGTPITAALLAMEVVSVGVLYYSALVPCLVSSITAYQIALLFGVPPTRFALSSVPPLTWTVLGQTALIAVACALLSIVFCVAVHSVSRLSARIIPSDYLRIAAGGALLIALTLLSGAQEYNGAGMNAVASAVAGNARPEAFLLKLVFTAVTIGTGFKGGEIIPSFFIGATFGCFAGGLVGLPPGFGAALGLSAVFCGVVNCPIASLVLSIEMFGSGGLILFALACGISYVLSGYFGLYSSQKIVYSKLRAEFIDKTVRKW